MSGQEKVMQSDKDCASSNKITNPNANSLDIQIKRVYEAADLADGKRVLVDRLWPRGLSKENAHLTEWMREVAPSPELRKQFCHMPERFAEFRERYRAELQQDPVHQEKVRQLLDQAAEGRLTLLYAAKDTVYNHAVVLQEVLWDVYEMDQQER